MTTTQEVPSDKIMNVQEAQKWLKTGGFTPEGLQEMQAMVRKMFGTRLREAMEDILFTENPYLSVALEPATISKSHQGKFTAKQVEGVIMSLSPEFMEEGWHMTVDKNCVLITSEPIPDRTRQDRGIYT